jgi:hypothetical protein
MNIYAPKAYYLAMALLYAAFSIYVLGVILMRRRRDEIVQVVLLVACGGISVFISSYLSWSYALQPQGRYLFPLLPMIAIFLYSVRDLLKRTALTSFVLICFLLSVYSFVFVGLRRINLPPASEPPVQTAKTLPRFVVSG